ncbi:MAG: hypothetical protein VB124_06030, partial [Burkholderia sp.]
MVEQTPVDSLLLHGPIETLGDAVGLRLSDEGVTRRHPPELDLGAEIGVVAQIRREDEVVPLLMISGDADGLRAGEFSHAVEHAHSNGN